MKPIDENGDEINVIGINKKFEISCALNDSLKAFKFKYLIHYKQISDVNIKQFHQNDLYNYFNPNKVYIFFLFYFVKFAAATYLVFRLFILYFCCYSYKHF